MADRSALVATRWVEQVLREHGWPPASRGVLAQLLTHLGDQVVEHYDCEVLDADAAGAAADDRRRGRSRPDSTATIVVFTATHLVVQTVDCTWRTRRLAVGVQVLRRSRLSALEASAEVDVRVPLLCRLHDRLAAGAPWLAGLVQRAGATEPLEPCDDLDGHGGRVVVDLTYDGLRGSVLTLPMDDDEASAERLARFLPSLTADLA